jgi:hypothetical protein
MSKDLDIQPVLALLSQSDSAYDVPAGPEMFVNGWLGRASELTIALAARAEPELAASLSRADRGQLELFLHADQDGRAIYARVHDDVSEPAVHDPKDKSVALTLCGTVGFEAYRTATDVTADEPWYVREFDAESIYACHPDTLHRLELSPDAVQLVIRDTADLPGGTVDLPRYRQALARACRQVEELVDDAGGNQPGRLPRQS